ncbi:MAG: hypothetical protein KGK08_01095 [Acidobacteriota bacterium]|nr:hypothetical protein [Acidobacteriota bacterium]
MMMDGAATAALLAMCVLVLVPLVPAGLALLNAGLGRSHSSAHAMLSALCAAATAALVFVMVGFSAAGLPGGAAHVLHLGGVSWSVLGAGPWGAHTGASGSFSSGLVLLLEMLGVAIAAIIPLSTGADRWRLGALCLASALTAAVTFPVLTHWVWGGGWLAQLGGSFGLGQGFQDFGGAATIQAVGGINALVVAWQLGARQGKYTNGHAAAIPGHNSVLALFGCLLLVPGWVALNLAGALLFYGAGLSSAPGVAVNTLLSASAAALAAVTLTRVRFTKPDASLTANGWVAGLVVSSATCMVLSPLMSIVAGALAGVMVVYLVEMLELRLMLDDPAGAIPVHGVAAVWGLLAAALLGHHAAGQLLAQLIGIGTLLGVVLPLSYALHLLANRLVPYRVDEYGERQGMDLFELGAGAYPEFVVHGDEARRR